MYRVRCIRECMYPTIRASIQLLDTVRSTCDRVYDGTAGTDVQRGAPPTDGLRRPSSLPVVRSAGGVRVT